MAQGPFLLTMLRNNATGKFVWDQQGKDTATLDCFYTPLGRERREAIEAVLMDLGPAFDKWARTPPTRSSVTACSMSSSSPPRCWRRSAGRSGRNRASCRTRTGPAGSGAPVGRC